MSNRISDSDLKHLCNEINKHHKVPLTAYAFCEKAGKHIAQVGNWHISGAYGGVNVHRMSNTGGGISTPLGGGYHTKRELYSRLKAYLAGLEEESERDFGYLQHGENPGPFRTERVNVKHQNPDIWHAYFEGQWRKVHVQVKRTFIVFRGARITIQIEGV